MTCLHLRAWSRANSLVPADGDKVKEAFQVRLADPKRLPIPLGREVPFAPLRGPWNPFVCAGAVDPWDRFSFPAGRFSGLDRHFEWQGRTPHDHPRPPSGNSPAEVRAALIGVHLEIPVFR
jgi:hypothetical protein